MRIKNNYAGDITGRNRMPSNLSLREVPQFSDKTEWGVQKAIFPQKI